MPNGSGVARPQASTTGRCEVHREYLAICQEEGRTLVDPGDFLGDCPPDIARGDSPAGVILSPDVKVGSIGEIGDLCEKLTGVESH